ncbi:MAG: apolipoprotein N-acyltransferase [Alphaproteobacteria bacterium]|nr:apolipoprotein N-acyltransferase [Alphaproteobacteria bacterium]
MAALTGIRRYGLAFLLGMAAAAALPPIYAVPLLLPAFVGLLWLIQASPNWRASAWIGWWFGLGHFAVGTYWISISLLVDAARFAWLIPFAVFGISGYLALYPALAAVATHVSRTRGVGRVLVFAAAWFAAEWLRGVALTGFPWNLMGTVWAFSDGMIQITSVIGVLGLGFVTVLLAALPAVSLGRLDGIGSNRARPRGWQVCVVICAALAGLWGFGAVRLAGAETVTVPDIRLRIVQPNIAQKNKWRPDLMERNFAHHLRLSTAPGFERTTLVIWPEAAATFPLATRPARRAAMTIAVPKGGYLITGAPRTTMAGVSPPQLWNSVYAIDEAGEAAAIYDKHHLVPFGEYLPLRDILKSAGIDKIAPGALDFSPGPGLATLGLPGLPRLSPLICYEVIFPSRVIAPGARPGWLLNVTNDAWFGRSSGPYQHLASARIRAVEEGLPLVRAANTGISAVVDSHGRVTARLGLNEEGVIDAALPAAVPTLTLFARYGNWIALLIAGAGVLIGLWVGRRV